MIGKLCCRTSSKKHYEHHLAIIFVLLLLVVVTCVPVGIYHKITGKEYSSLAIILGICLPAFLFGIICICATVNCLKGPARNSRLHHGRLEDSSHSCCLNHNTQINLNVGYEADVSSEPSTDGSRTAEEEEEYSMVGRETETLSRGRHFRSLSASDLEVSYHESSHRVGPEKSAYSPPHGRTESQRMSRTVSGRSRQDSVGSRHGRFKRSLSESRAHRCRKDESTGDTGYISSPACYVNDGYCTSDEQKQSEYNFHEKSVKSPPRIERVQAGNPRFHRESRKFVLDEKELTDCDFSRHSKSGKIGEISKSRFYVEDKRFGADVLNKHEFHTKPIEKSLRGKRPNLQIDNTDRLKLYEGVYFIPEEQRSTGSVFYKRQQPYVQVGNSNNSGFHRESKHRVLGNEVLNDSVIYHKASYDHSRLKQSREGKYPVSSNQKLRECEIYETLKGLPGFRPSPDSLRFHRKSQYYFPSEEVRDYEIYNRRLKELSKFEQPNTQSASGNKSTFKFQR